jgi:hypothetical protein
MNRLISISIILFSYSTLTAQLIGIIDGDTLKAEFSPYHVVGNVTVRDLTIQPGVTILFDDNHDFKIDVGVLKAEGFYSDSIIFKPDTNNFNGWRGLLFKDCILPSELKYCRIKGSSNFGIKIEGGIAPNISNCKIDHNQGDGVEIKQAQIQFSHCIIENNGNNGVFLDEANTTILSSIITKNINAGLLSSDNRDSLRLINTVVADNQGTGLLSIGGYVNVKNSIIYYNGVEISTDTSLTDVTYSDIRRTPVYQGIGNINDLPQFDDLTIYTLSPSQSPCIDTGDPNILYEDLYFPPSLGSYRNDMGAYGGSRAGEWYSPLYIQPNSLNFGKVSNDSTVTLTLTVKNYRDSTIIADSIYFIGNDTSVFRSGTDYLNIDILDSTHMNISFTPDTVDFFSVMLLLKTLKHGKLYIPVTGEGVASEINFVTNQLDFETVALGDTLTLDFPIINTGGDTLRIYQIYTTNTRFITSASFMTINPNPSYDTLFVTFIPDSIDILTESLILFTNDPNEDSIAISLFGQGIGPIINLNSSIYNFGSVFLNSDSSLSIIIENNGNDSLVISDIQITENDSGLFEFLNDSLVYPVIINPDCTFSVDICFKPQELGTDSAIVEIQSNDPFNPMVLGQLIGKGIAPVIDVKSLSLDFGIIPFNTSTIDSIVIKNTGNFILIVEEDSLIISGNHPQFFDIDSLSANQVVPGDSALMFIKFNADSEGVKQAVLQVASNDPINSKIIIPLSGESWAPQISVSAGELNFGEVLKDSVSYLSLFIYNNGLGDLIIFEDNLKIFGIDSSYFQIDSINKYVLNPTDSALIKIQFTASKVDTNQAILNIVSNDPLQEYIQINLSGFVLIPFIHLSQSLVDFGTIPLFAYMHKSFYIYNQGYKPLTVYFDSLEIIGSDSIYFSIDSLLSDSTIQPVDSVKLILGFNAADIGMKNASFIIKSDDRVLPELTVSLVGSSDTPQISLSNSSLDFGIVPAGSDTFVTLIIQNSGQGKLILYKEGLFISGTDSLSFFTISLDSNITINPNDSTEINVELITDNVGYKSATLQIQCNDFHNPLLNVDLTGLIIDNMSATVSLDQNHSTSELIFHQNGNLRFIVYTNFNTDSVVLNYQQGGADEFNKALCTNLGQMNLWEITIDSSWITPKGFDYFVRVYHGWTFTDWPEKPKSLPVHISKMEFPETTPKEIYQKISIPFYTQNQTLNELFGNNLGNYDKSKYRIFDCENGEDYTEITNLDKGLSPGKSLWLITKDEVRLDFTSAKTIPTDTTFQLSLRAGWNMISTPFAFPINWNDNDNKHLLRFHDGSDWTFTSVLEPYKGYAVKVKSDTIVNIQPKEYESTNILAEELFFADIDWSINIKAEQNKLRDHFNFAGSRLNAIEGIDRFDYPEPPPIGSFISLYFTQESNISGEIEKFSTDFKNIDSEGYIYDFELVGNVSGKKDLLIETNLIPDEFRFVVVKPEAKIKYESAKIELYSNYNKLKLIVGTEEFVRTQTKEYSFVPVTFQLEQNYPNPFNPSTIIKYQLPEFSNISINIYNVLGQKVKSLINNDSKDAGYYKIAWNGTNNSGNSVTTGVYFLNFKSKMFSKTIKMLLQR